MLRSSPQGLDRTVAINVADPNGDGIFDLRRPPVKWECTSHL